MFWNWKCATLTKTSTELWESPILRLLSLKITHHKQSFWWRLWSLWGVTREGRGKQGGQESSAAERNQPPCGSCMRASWSRGFKWGMQSGHWTRVYKKWSFCTLARLGFTSPNTPAVFFSGPFEQGLLIFFFPYSDKPAVFPDVLIQLQLPPIWKEMANEILNVYCIPWEFSFVFIPPQSSEEREAGCQEIPSQSAADLVPTLGGTLPHAFY